MKMKITSLNKAHCALLLLALLVSACCINNSFGKKISASGETATKQLDITDFNAIEISGFTDLNIVNKQQSEAQVTIDTCLLQYLNYTVDNGKLKIWFTEGAYIENIPTIATIAIPTNANFAISTSGSSNIKTDSLVVDRLEISLAGSGNTKFEKLYATSSIEINTAGSGNINIAGETNNFSINTTGSANINTGGFIAKNVTIKSAGSCHGTVFANDTINVESAGSANIKYYGNPSNKNINGSGSIDVNSAK